MSIPFHRKGAAIPARASRTENGFWGLDLSAGELAAPSGRAADTENLIWRGNAVAVRPGYERLQDYNGARVNGIWFYGNTLIVHAGTCLYRHTGARFQTAETVGTGMNDAPSQGVLRRQSYTKRVCSTNNLDAWTRSTEERDLLFINDGAHYWFYNGIALISAADPHWGEDVSGLLDGAHPLSFYATAPFTGVALNPDDGLGDVDPRGANRLTQFQTDSFCVDSATDCFELTCAYRSYQECYPPEVQIRARDGGWYNLGLTGQILNAYTARGKSALFLVEIAGGMRFTVDQDHRITALGQGLYTVAADGQDNVRITYAVFKEAPERITGATAQGLYGPDGTDSVLFLGGSAARPGEDVFSAPNDFLCFYETSTERLGDPGTPVGGYCRLSDGRLAVLKNAPDQSSVFFRSYKLVQIGETQAGVPYEVEAYPSRPGAAVQGCVNPRTVGAAGNEPCFLGTEGLYTVHSVSNELINLDQTLLRSAAVGPLLEQWDKSACLAVNWRKYYLLVCGAEALITDGRQDAGGNLRFLKWRFGHPITALARRNEELYLGSADGRLFLLNGAAADDGEGVFAYWETPALEDHGRKLLLRRAFLAVKPDYGASLRVWILRNGAPGAKQTVPAGRTDFGAPDFSAFSFDGTDAVRWVPVAGDQGAGRSFSLRFALPEGRAVSVWGMRMIYEKGESVK